jgi:hypothetical protein
MIVAQTTNQQTNAKGLLIAIPFDEMYQAVAESRTLNWDGDEEIPHITILFGPSHKLLVDTIKKLTPEGTGEDDLETFRT